MQERELILGRYRPLDKAGAGGYGTVFLAWDTRIQRRVAVKCIQLDAPLPTAPAPAAQEPPPWDDSWDARLDDPAATDAEPQDPYGRDIPGLEEARTAAMLSHPNIVGVLDFEAEGSVAYLIMEYVDGATLTQLLHDHPDAIDADVVACVLADVAAALGYAHENAVLHLDIKPDNIMVNRQGQVKVTDFGLSELSGAGGFGRAAGGTIGYMPPEQMRLEALDERCDEWALASVAYEMIAGENPFWADDLQRAQEAIANAELVLPSLCMPGIDEAADDVVFYALDPDRRERYASVADFAEELLPWLGDAQAGRAKLRAMVDESRDDTGAREEAEAAAWAALPLLDRMGARVRGGLLRAFGAAGCGTLAFVGLANTAWLPGPASWPVAGLVALVVLAAALVPHLGALLACAALVAGMASQGALLAAVATALLVCLWWWASGRHGRAQAAVACSPALLGAFGMAGVTPLAAGWLLRARDAAASTLLAGAAAIMLAALGSGSLGDWQALAYWHHLGPGFEQALLLVLAAPRTWIALACWTAASLVVSLACRRGSRAAAVAGMVAGGALCLVPALAAPLLGASAIDGSEALRAILCLVVGVLLASCGVPAREEGC